MKYVIFDTETTGIDNKSEVIQMSAIVCNDKLDIINIYDMYFNTDSEIPEETIMIHNLTKEKLIEFSKGDDFLKGTNDFFRKLNDEKDIIFIGYNVLFDIRLINQTLYKYHCEFYDFGTEIKSLRTLKGRHYFCLMKAITDLQSKSYNKKLIEVIYNVLNIGREKLSESYITLLQEKNIENRGESFHNALFDTYCTLLLLKKFYKDCIL